MFVTGQADHAAACTELAMAVFIERGVVVVAVVLMIGAFLVVVTQIAVVLQQVHDHLRHTRPLMQFHGAGTVDQECEGEEEAVHERGRM